MKNLSERLEAIIEPVWSHEASPADLTALLREAAALAKRYEDAPVIGLYGQRVRIVLDKEG